MKLHLAAVHDNQTFHELEGACCGMHCFFDKLNGTRPSPAEALSITMSLPDGAQFDQKEVFLIRESNIPIGCIDLVVSYPQPGSVLIGMFALVDEYCGKGLGRFALNSLEAIISQRKVYTSLVAYVPDRLGTAGFWKSCGFVEVRQVEPYSYGGINSRRLEFQKAVTAR